VRTLLTLIVTLLPTTLLAQPDDWSTPSLGFEYIGIDDFQALVENTRIKPPGKIGIVVVDVAPNGPSVGKLNAYDIITKIDQTPIKSAADMEAFIKSLKPGQECLVSGQGATTQNGLIKWKKANVKLAGAKTRKQVFIDALVTKIDDVNDSTTYRHAHTPESFKAESNLSLIVRKEKGGEPHLLLRVSKVGNMVFTKQLFFKIDGKTLKVGVQPNIDIGDQAEWDVLPAESNKELVMALITTKQAVTMRYNGTQEYEDRQLTLSEIYAMRGVYQAYLAMGGKPL
jgi:hypothetical protein